MRAQRRSPWPLLLTGPILLLALLLDLTVLQPYPLPRAAVWVVAASASAALLFRTRRVRSSPTLTGEDRDAVAQPLARTRRAETDDTSLVSQLAHELRTPLTAIQGFTELLLTRSVPKARCREWLQIIHDETQRLNTILEQALDLHRLDSGETSLQLEAVTPQTWLTNVAAHYAAHDRSCGISVDVGPKTPAIWIDRLRMERALHTLLELVLAGSAPFTPISLQLLPACPAPYSLHRGRRACSGGPALVITYQADGPQGAPLARPAFPNESQDGGLALAAAEKIVALHGSAIWAVTPEAEGRGTGRLGICLPPAPVDRGADKEAMHPP